jgi:hypothetical protein
MTEATRWPIDYDSLTKGTIIPVQRIEEITQTQRGTSAYDFAVLRLSARIERELHDRGRIWTVKSEKGALKILTDSEAAVYNHALQVQARASELRRFALQQAVDVSSLGTDVRKQHERNMEIDGKYIQARIAVREQLRLTASKRNVPGLPEKSTVRGMA